MSLTLLFGFKFSPFKEFYRHLNYLQFYGTKPGERKGCNNKIYLFEL